MLIYLCDDSECDIFRLKHYLCNYAEERKLIFDLTIFSSGERLLEAFRQSAQKPELIFLDIFMPGLNGMDTARQLRDMRYSGGIIFTTSSMEHAMDSYEVNALYYLQKPYDRNHFENAMSRCGSLLQKAHPHFSFTLKKREISIPFEDILFFETGQSHSIVLHTKSGVYSFSGTLTQIMSFFEGAEQFLLVGRSFLINLIHVTEQRENDLIMSDGSIVQVPVRKREEVFKALENYNS